jgi:Tol biopolymer transport system component
LGTRFTFDPAADRFAVWSPDSSRVIFSSVRKGHFDLYQKPADGTGIEEVILESKVDKNAESWSPDGRFLLYTIYDPSTRQDLWVLPLDGQRKPFPFLQTPSNENYSQFSPDGRWVAYSSDESGRMEIYVAPFTGGPSTLGGKRQVSKDGGFHARWRHDGTEIFYQYNGRMMAAEVNGKGSSFEVGAVHPLFERRLITTSGYAYDVSADGQHFLVNALAGQKASNPVTLVINWGADLKR